MCDNGAHNTEFGIRVGISELVAGAVEIRFRGGWFRVSAWDPGQALIWQEPWKVEDWVRHVMSGKDVDARDMYTDGCNAEQ